ncbi:PaaI family thioesterase [Bordetella sp. 2513F-2]
MPSASPSEWDHRIPFLHFIGAQLTHWEPGNATVELLLDERHMNRSGVAHGGLYSVLIDAAGGLSGCHSGDRIGRKAITLSLTTSFTGQVAGGRLSAHARVRKRGTRIFFSTVEIYDDQGQLAALGEGTFRLRSEPSETAATAPAVAS